MTNDRQDFEHPAIKLRETFSQQQRLGPQSLDLFFHRDVKGIAATLFSKVIVTHYFFLSAKLPRRMTAAASSRRRLQNGP
jgi:hypothetical protein